MFLTWIRGLGSFFVLFRARSDTLFQNYRGALVAQDEERKMHTPRQRSKKAFQGAVKDRAVSIFLSFDVVLATVANRELMCDYYKLDELCDTLESNT